MSNEIQRYNAFPQSPDFFLNELGSYLTYFSNDSPFASGRAIHQYPRVVYVNSGTGICHVGPHTFDFPSSCVIFARQGERIILECPPTTPLVAFLMAFRPDLPVVTDDLMKVLFSDPGPLSIPAQHLEQMRRLVRGFIAEQRRMAPFYEYVVGNGTQVMLIQLYRTRKNINMGNIDGSKDSLHRVQDVLDYVKDYYYEPYTLEKVAELADLSKRQFSNLCHQLCKMSFFQYLGSVRTLRAKELLETTSMSVVSIALMVGFEDLSAFYRTFKKHFGAPPLSFRDQLATS